MINEQVNILFMACLDMVPVNMTDSAKKLMALLKEDRFTSGDHVDYFDF